MRYEGRVTRRFVPLALAASLCLLGAAPTHVQTADYFGGYAGTHDVAPAVAARWLTWAETNVADSPRMRALGVKTLLYTDPNRQISGEPLYTADESSFAHDCGGQRIATLRSGQYLMDPHSPAMTRLWKAHVRSYSADGHFDAIFEDDADDLAYTRGVPCRYDAAAWLSATNAMQRALGYPVVYNGLANFTDRTVSPAIGLNATAIGGMMEECYAVSPSRPKSSGDAWYVTEATELAMARAGKLFFCYGNDTTAADASLDARLYVYASFLLSYDPATSVLWEYYQGPARFHVMPEAQLVPMQPRVTAQRVDDLSVAGTYQRAFGACYLAGRDQGPCVVAVNPSQTARPLALPGYRRTLVLGGGSVIEGGTARVEMRPPPAQLDPLSATIAFR